MKTEYDARMRDQAWERSQGDRVETYGSTMISITLDEYRGLKNEIERLRQHVKDLDADLNGTIADCNEHHGGE